MPTAGEHQPLVNLASERMTRAGCHQRLVILTPTRMLTAGDPFGVHQHWRYFFLLPGKVCLTLFGQNSSEWVKRLFFFLASDFEWVVQYKLLLRKKKTEILSRKKKKTKKTNKNNVFLFPIPSWNRVCEWPENFSGWKNMVPLATQNKKNSQFFEIFAVFFFLLLKKFTL